ncbi:MAG: hypothetical protein ACLU0O_01150 [Collinsella sp.]
MLSSAPSATGRPSLDALFASVPAGTLVVVDQFRNIGSLAVRRAAPRVWGSPTCPASPPAAPPGCSPARPRPTSATPR